MNGNYRGTCGECGRTFDQLKSTAKEWREFCSKDCERKAAKHGRRDDQHRRDDQGRRDDHGPLPVPTRETEPVVYTRDPVSSPTHTTRSGGLGFSWPVSAVVPAPPKGAPLMAPRKSCVHDGQSPAFTLRGGQVHIYGARATSLMAPGASLGHLDLIIDASGDVTAKGRFVDIAAGKRFQELNRYVFPEVVRLNWPDMTAPSHVGIGFWSRLLAILPGHVCLSCIGSHGRTGTAMAALLVADGMEAEVAIKAVRDKHCHHAIETAAQGDYIRGLEKQRKQAQAAQAAK